MNKRKLILRADGNSQIGMGHVYRLLALAEILNEDFESTFAIANPDSFILDNIKKRCHHHIILNSANPYRTPDEFKTDEEIDFDIGEYLTGEEVVVTDGYLFGKNYQLAVKSTGARLVCIDDLATTEFFADVIINHAPGFDESLYKTQPYTKILSGLNYAILRKAFFKPLKENVQGKISKAFISLGGADFCGYTEELIRLVQAVNKFVVLNVLCASSFSAELLDRLKRIQDNSGNVILHFNLDADKIVELLDECTHAFVSASTVLMESYSRGLTCFAGHYTNNQKNIYDGFIGQKLAGNLGKFRELNYKMVISAIQNEHTLKLLTTAFASRQNIRRAFSAIR